MGGYDANLELEKIVEIASNLATWSRRDATMSFLWGKQPFHTTTHGVATMMQAEAVETIRCFVKLLWGCNAATKGTWHHWSLIDEAAARIKAITEENTSIKV